MFQTINGIEVFVVDLSAGLPALPIHSLNSPELAPYAQALGAAIRQGIVKDPGKYAINITGEHWNVFRVDEPKVITIVRRYDEPSVSYGFHYFDLEPELRQGYRETEAPVLCGEALTEAKLDALLAEGFREVETPLAEMDDTMKRIVSRSCPIEFHRSLSYACGRRGSDQYGEIADTIHIADRIRVFTKS